MKLKNTIIALAFSATGISSAHAAINFNFGGSSGNLSDYNYSSTVSGIQANITAWGSSAEFENFTRENLYRYGGGLSVISTTNDTPQHAIGDFNTEEFLLFEFSEAVAITNIGNGYARECKSSSDSNCPQGGNTSTNWSTSGVDASVLALSGGGSINMENIDHSDFASGWDQFGGTFNSGGTTSIGNDAGQDQVFSNVWLIGNANEFLTSAGGYEDFFKLNLVSVSRAPSCQPGDPCGGSSVPSPATAALLGLGLLILRERKLL